MKPQWILQANVSVARRLIRDSPTDLLVRRQPWGNSKAGARRASPNLDPASGIKIA